MLQDGWITGCCSSPNRQDKKDRNRARTPALLHDQCAMGSGKSCVLLKGKVEFLTRSEFSYWSCFRMDVSLDALGHSAVFY